MFHFPSTLPQSSNSASRRPEGNTLNATQQKTATHPVFLELEEELHDARRVHADGQEDDLRCALNMVINRVSALSSMLSEAYKTQAELEVQLNVARSNLKLVIANNEMLEDALTRDVSKSKEVGWHRTNSSSLQRRNSASGESKDGCAHLERSQSLDIQVPAPQEPIATPPSSGGGGGGGGVPTSNVSNAINALQDNRFFKFRFSSGTGSATPSLTRPSTPSAQNSTTSSHVSHLTSPSLPSLPSAKSKEIEELTAELEREKASRKKIKAEKAAMESELESLSQALFEEANKMVRDERRMRAEVEEELNELRTEKEALRKALRLIASETAPPTTNAGAPSPIAPNPAALLPEGGESHPEAAESSSSRFVRTRSRSSSRVGTKSRPQSMEAPSPSFDDDYYYSNKSDGSLSSSSHREEPSQRQQRETGTENENEGNMLPILPLPQEDEEGSQSTPRYGVMRPSKQVDEDLYLESSPWADVPSSNPDARNKSSTSATKASVPVI